MIDFKDCYDDLVEWYNRLDDKDRSSHIVDCLETLKTLVDKVMPRKVEKKHYTDVLGHNVIFKICPRCHNEVSDNRYYCTYCGQALNYEEESENERSEQ